MLALLSANTQGRDISLFHYARKAVNMNFPQKQRPSHVTHNSHAPFKLNPTHHTNYAPSTYQKIVTPFS